MPSSAWISRRERPAARSARARSPSSCFSCAVLCLPVPVEPSPLLPDPPRAWSQRPPTGPLDRRPLAGHARGVDLADLYALLPAAEEEDLLEQLAQERQREAWEAGAAWLAWPADRPRTFDLWSGAPTDDDEDDAPPEAEQDGDQEDRPLRLPVLLALLEHRLGAVRLDSPTEP